MACAPGSRVVKMCWVESVLRVIRLQHTIRVEHVAAEAFTDGSNTQHLMMYVCNI